MKEITLNGWLVKDETEMSPDIHLNKPCRIRNEMYEEDNFLGRWISDGNVFRLDKGLFPAVFWESEPRKIQLVIKFPD